MFHPFLRALGPGICLLTLLSAVNPAFSQVKTSASSPSLGGLGVTQSAGFERRVAQVLSALRDGQGKALAGLVHPSRGLRFIPYAWDDLEETVTLQRKEVERLFKSKEKRLWGKYDGSGDPIRMSSAQYIRRFAWNVDYSKAAETERLPLSAHLTKHYAYRGDNADVLELFPNAWTVTYFFPGLTAPKGGAMDWSWLTLVLLPEGEEWSLVGLVHKEWTI